MSRAGSGRRSGPTALDLLDLVVILEEKSWLGGSAMPVEQTKRLLGTRPDQASLNHPLRSWQLIKPIRRCRRVRLILAVTAESLVHEGQRTLFAWPIPNLSK
jgi:hypothetical protein